jgi:enamine deaminase RidA (YjgF/YER057c/UK114 family)
LTAQIWLSDIEDFAEFNAVWDVWVAKDAAPTRVCVESRLVVPALKVEVAVTAAV